MDQMILIYLGRLQKTDLHQLEGQTFELAHQAALKQAVDGGLMDLSHPYTGCKPPTIEPLIVGVEPYCTRDAPFSVRPDPLYAQLSPLQTPCAREDSFLSHADVPSSAKE